MFRKLFIFSICFSCFIFASCFLNLESISYAKTIDEEISDISKQIEELEKSLAPLKSESSQLQSKISSAKSSISKTEKQISDLGTRIIDKEADLEVQKTLLDERLRRYYINTKKFNPLMIFLSNNESSQLIRLYTWYQSIMSQDKEMINQFAQDINSLSKNKEKLEADKVKLAALKADMEKRFGYLATEIKKAEDYKKELSAKQQALIAEKTAMFNTSVGDVSSSDDPASRSDYNPGFSPAFAVFSFGAPHRKGMSQFGALGRSQAGQNYEAILKAYYGDIRIEKIDTSGNIKTTVGELNFEENYLLGIAEMPASWADKGGYEALKAQAIAARTYALNSTNMRSGTICVTEACQVYKTSKYQNPGRWKQAVEDTRGMVIKSNKTGNIFSTMYASTSGGAIYGYTAQGHSTPQIWDTSCGSQSCWPNDAYERQAGSSWFYKAWYKLRDGRACGRSHPWLTQSEFADIINAQVYYQKTGDSSHLSQYDTGGCFSKDADAWSKDELARQMNDKGGAISSINSVSVDYSTSGVTQKVRVSTDKGDYAFDGDAFKEIFTLRAPGGISAKSSLFNIVKK